MSIINYTVILILTEQNIIKCIYRYAYFITMQMQSKFEHKVYDILDLY